MPGSAEDVPLESDSVDSVLLTFSLCTIPHPDRALAEARRVLKPEGKLVFCEHAQAPDENVARWQERINPIWKRLFGGCHLNRDIAGLIESGGFIMDEVDRMYLPNTPRIAAFNIWGCASAS